MTNEFGTDHPFFFHYFAAILYYSSSSVRRKSLLESRKFGQFEQVEYMSSIFLFLRIHRLTIISCSLLFSKRSNSQSLGSFIVFSLIYLTLLLGEGFFFLKEHFQFTYSSTSGYIQYCTKKCIASIVNIPSSISYWHCNLSCVNYSVFKK